jgi:hypothetical protein
MSSFFIRSIASIARWAPADAPSAKISYRIGRMTVHSENLVQKGSHTESTEETE